MRNRTEEESETVLEWESQPAEPAPIVDMHFVALTALVGQFYRGDTQLNLAQQFWDVENGPECSVDLFKVRSGDLEFKNNEM